MKYVGSFARARCRWSAITLLVIFSVGDCSAEAKEQVADRGRSVSGSTLPFPTQVIPETDLSDDPQTSPRNAERRLGLGRNAASDSSAWGVPLTHSTLNLAALVGILRLVWFALRRHCKEERVDREPKLLQLVLLVAVFGWTSLVLANVATTSGEVGFPLLTLGLMVCAIWAFGWNLVPICRVFAAPRLQRESNEALNAEATRRKVQEMEVDSERELFQSVLDSSESHVSVVDEFGKIVATNRFWKEFSEVNGGLSHGVGANYLDACRRAEGACAATGIEIAKGVEEVIAGERDSFVLEYPSGESTQEQWFEVRVSPLKSTEHRGAVIVHSSVADRIRAREQLTQASEHLERLSLVAKYTDNAVVITDAKTRIEWVNDGFTRLTGYQPEEVVGRTPGAILQGAETDPETVAHMRSQIAKEEGFDVEVVNYTKDGRPYWLSMEVRPIRNEANAVTRFIAIERDITDRKMQEEESDALRRELEQQNQMLDTILQSVADGIMAVDGDGNFICFNQSAVEVLGIAEMVGITPTDWPEIYRLRDTSTRELLPAEQLPLVRAMRGEKVSRQELLIERQDDVVISVNATPLADRNKGGAVAVFRDVTELKHAEKDRTELASRMLELSRQTGMAEIATGVLHNVGNVLNSANVSANLLQNTVTSKSFSKLQKATEIITENEDRLGEFLTTDRRGKFFPRVLREIVEMLAQERESWDQELQSLVDSIEHIKEIVAMQQTHARASSTCEPIDVCSLLNNAIEMSGVGLNGQIRLEFDDTNAWTVVAQRNKVLQILINLFSNAAQSIAESGVHQGNIRIEMTQESGDLVLAIQDNGVGISAENLERIFSHGFTTKPDGHGFGLHHSVISAEEMGGSLTAQSKGAGEGATFILTLPLESRGVDVSSATNVALV